MKKYLSLIFAGVMALCLVACSSKGRAEPVKSVPDYYGTWVVTELHSLDGSISDERFEMALNQMRENKQLFYMDIGDESIMYTPDGNGGYSEVSMTADFDNLLFKTGPSDPGMSFKYEGGKIIIDEPSSKVQFVLEKQ